MIRFFEILPGITTWLILILPFFLAPFFPKIVAIFILIYMTKWSLRLIKFHFFLLLAVRQSRKYEKLNWREMLNKEFSNQWGKMLHAVIIPILREEEFVIETTLEAIHQSDFPKQNILVCLAFEERNPENRELAKRLQKKYPLFVIFHPSNLPDEIPCKGANITYAGKKLTTFLREKGIAPQNVIVTTLDADNIIHPLYFSILTYHVLKTPDPKKKSFQPLPLAFNNIWQTPVFARLIALVNSYWQFSRSSQLHSLRNTAAHAQTLEALEELNFWSKTSINEDSHQYFRAYFHFCGDHEVIPLFIPIYQDAVKGRTYAGTLRGQYRQLRRWAFSSRDIAYIATQWFKQWKTIPFLKTFGEFFQYLDTHIMWATGPLLVFFYHALPGLVHEGFRATVFSFNFAAILNVYFVVALLSGFIFSALSLTIIPSRPRTPATWISSIFQWVLSPFVFIIYGSLPAIDAQTRLLLGKSLPFQATEKHREHGSLGIRGFSEASSRAEISTRIST